MTTRLSTGIEGLDAVLHGGLLPGQIYMIRGQPGAGKTTLAVQFLMAGARRGESVLFVTLSESERELRASAAGHGWDLGGMQILDIHPDDEGSVPDPQYTIFHPADVELAPATRRITEAMERTRPTRVAFDSLTEVRLLSRDSLRYRRQILGLKGFLLSKGVTALFLGESGRPELDVEIASIVHGVIALSLSKGTYGMARRAVEVEKCRGSDFQSGMHPLRIVRGGIEVFPRLLATEHGREFDRDRLPSGIAEIDLMLGGGLDRGTSTLICGHAGVGKTTLGVQFLHQAARRGERAVLYSFDEGPAEIIHRCDGIATPIRESLEQGLLRIEKVNPLLLYPDEFAGWVRDEVERRGTRIVMIDTLNGYRLSMPDEHYLVGHMHQLVSYLNRMGVASLLINEVSNLTGDFAASQIGMSYLTDTIVLLKYFEFEGAMHKAIGTLKKRLGDHEKVLRDFRITPQGIRVGQPLPQLQGILQGEPRYGGSVSGLLQVAEVGGPSG
jgi:circadian clock protein KaiC